MQVNEAADEAFKVILRSFNEHFLSYPTRLSLPLSLSL